MSTFASPLLLLMSVPVTTPLPVLHVPTPMSDYVRVRMALTSAPFAATPAWTDITSQCRAASVRRSRSGGYGGTTNPTQITVTVDNRDARWTPGGPYASAPYAGNIVPDRLIDVSISNDGGSSWAVIATGFVDSISVSSSRFDSTATITASCALRLLQQYELDEWVRPAELTGTRMAALWAKAGIPSGGGQADFVGAVFNGTVMLAPATLSGSALSIAQEINRAEGGLFYAGVESLLQFLDRFRWAEATVLSSSQATLDEAEWAGQGEVEHLSSAFTTHRSVSGSGVTGAVKRFTSGTLPANFPATTGYLNNLPVLYDGDVEMCVEGLQKHLQSNDVDEPRPQAVSVMVAATSGVVVQSVLDELFDRSIDLFNYVSLTYRPIGWSSDHTYEGRVESIEHEFRPDSWRVRLGFGHALSVWNAEYANHYYVLGSTLVSDRKGAL